MNAATLGVGAATNGEFQDNSHLEPRLEPALTAVVVNTLQTRGSRQRSPRCAKLLRTSDAPDGRAARRD